MIVVVFFENYSNHFYFIEFLTIFLLNRAVLHLSTVQIFILLSLLLSLLHGAPMFIISSPLIQQRFL